MNAALRNIIFLSTASAKFARGTFLYLFLHRYRYLIFNFFVIIYLKKNIFKKNF